MISSSVISSRREMWVEVEVLLVSKNWIAPREVELPAVS